MKELMRGILVHLSMNQWNRGYTDLYQGFDEETWDYIVEESAKTGINTIFIDVGNAVEFASHPELAMKNAWTRKRMHDEIARCRALGITLLPKLNFSTVHDEWLGEYGKMVCTSTYYRVVNDLIREVYEIFEKPAYIHIGLDEEDAKHCTTKGLCIYRNGEQYWHDVRFYIDCVTAVGAKPVAWSCPLFENPEEYKAHIGPDEMILMPWNYNAFREDHWTPIESRAEYVTYYNEGEYAKMNIRFVEEDPFLVNYREKVLPLMKEGYLYIPCASVFNRCDYNHIDMMEYFKEKAPASQILGYISAPWFSTKPKNKPYFEETFRFMKEAWDAIYGE